MPSPGHSRSVLGDKDICYDDNQAEGKVHGGYGALIRPNWPDGHDHRQHAGHNAQGHHNGRIATLPARCCKVPTAPDWAGAKPWLACSPAQRIAGRVMVYTYHCQLGCLSGGIARAHFGDQNTPFPQMQQTAVRLCLVRDRTKEAARSPQYGGSCCGKRIIFVKQAPCGQGEQGVRRQQRPGKLLRKSSRKKRPIGLEIGCSWV